MSKNEKTWDKLFGIKTTGRDDSRSKSIGIEYDERIYG